MSGEGNLSSIIKEIKTAGVKDREKVLTNLKHILRKISKFDGQVDASFHELYEVLFQVTAVELSTYYKAKAPTTVSAAENRLSVCASSVRLAVEVGVRVIRAKTVKSLLDHIIQTLLPPGGAFCEPIALDYAKCLKAVIGHQPHVEHLPQKERERVTLFCADCMKKAESGLADVEVEAGYEKISTSTTINGLSYRSSRSHFKEPSGSQNGRSLAKQIAEEMVTCIYLLSAAPNASNGNSTSNILWALIDFLKSSTIAGPSHQEAFEAINNLLAWTRTEDTKLTRGLTVHLVRLVRIYWSTKTISMKDEMVIMMTYLRPYIFAVAQQDVGLALQPELYSALDVMRSEYCKRTDQNQLQIDDLRFCLQNANAEQINHICTRTFQLRCTGPRAESYWTLVYLLASLCNVLSEHDRKEASEKEHEPSETDQRPRKRQRFTDEFEETLSSSVKGTHNAKIGALQVLVFIAQQKVFTSRQVTKVIEKLSPTCSEDSGAAASWALIAIASFASQRSSSDPSLVGRWISVWQLATRAMTIASTCRAACHLLEIMTQFGLVPQPSMSEIVMTVTSSMELGGPALFADSVAHLLASVAKISRQINPASSAATADSILSWLFRHFVPSKFEDKLYAGLRVPLEAGDAIGLITSCLNQVNKGLTRPPFLIWGNIGQAWLACEEQQSLIAYLLLEPDICPFTHDHVHDNGQIADSNPQSSASGETIVLNNLVSELHRTQETWNQMINERPQGTTLDLSFLCNSCCIVTSIAFSCSFRDEKRQAQLKTQVSGLLRSISNFMSSVHCSQEKVDSMLISLSQGFVGLLHPKLQSEHSESEKLLCNTVANAIASRRSNKDLTSQDDNEHDMEIDNKYDSQDSGHDDQANIRHELKNESTASFSLLALRSSTSIYANIVSIQHEVINEGKSSSKASERVIDYILSLPEIAVLCSCRVVSSLPLMGLNLNAQDSERLLEYYAEIFLRSYAYERSEVAIGSVLDMMSSLAHTWTDPANKSLFDLGIDIYIWYTKTALSGGVLSRNMQKRVASLLLQLCQIDTDYGHDSDMPAPSVSTSLFKLLQFGSVTVQFYLADRISAVFGSFVLSTHPAMFDDLQMSLPAEAEWLEGIAMRLLFLGKLASAWHSLLRQCVYYIFETAGRVQDSAEHAARCVGELSKSLKFKSPRKLFSLFAPQLLHTWLETHTVTALPFATFQYASLRDLLVHNEAEITAQLLVKENEEGMHALTTSLKISLRELVKYSFAKCLAYCISWDIAKPPPGSGTPTSESRLRKLIDSRDEFKTLVQSQFPVVMGHFFSSLQQEDVLDKWLEKRPSYTPAAKALEEIKNFSFSDRILPPSQQPSFKSKYLCDQIERLCRRVSQDPVNPWDPSSFALAARMLLDSIDSALGPLHTSLILRRLRLLICMAGEVATSGFPVEMLIHSLRPLLSDGECADDAIGVLQYLFLHGQPYLKTDLPFVYGTVTLMILQMRIFSSAEQDSTSQGNQHKATVQRMQNFQSWLVKYLQQCRLSDDSTSSIHEEEFANALAHLNLPGNAFRGSAESKLLLLLLDQQVDTDKVLLRPLDRDQALLLLSRNFQIPNSTTNDCLGNDSDCVHFGQKLWNSLDITSLDKSFVAWVAAALGRSYVSSGIRPKHREKSIGERQLRMPGPRYEGVARSQVAIAKHLADSLFSMDPVEASIADHTLRRIVVSFSEAKEAGAFDQMLPAAIVPAIANGSFGYQPLWIRTPNDPSILTDSHSLPQLFEISHHLPLEEWVQRLSLGLCHAASSIAILPALKLMLESNHDFAMVLFPAIVHIILAREMERETGLRGELSNLLTTLLADDDALSKQRYLLQLLLYLRMQPLPGEKTQLDRLRWLDVDLLLAAKAAAGCGMPTTALLLTESASPSSQASRRTSNRASSSQLSISQVPQQLLLSVFKDVEEPDSFYGVEQPASLNSVLDRLDYEGDGFRSLMFRSAQTDSVLRRLHQIAQVDTVGLVRSLSTLNLNSITFALLSGGLSDTRCSSDELLSSARELQQWDIIPPRKISGEVTNCFTAFQELSRANDHQSVRLKIREILLEHLEPVTRHGKESIPSHAWFGTLASLVEIGEVLDSLKPDHLSSLRTQMISRQDWMQVSSFEDFRCILSNRHTLFSVLAQNSALRSAIRLELKDCRCIEIESLLNISAFAREHSQLQEALTATTQISELINECNALGLEVDAAAKLETASVLWDSKEATSSVQVLEDALALSDLDTPDSFVGRSGLLAQLAHQLAEARLERPEEILAKYLKPAITHLQGRNEGHEAGKVFYEFATFCDSQLQNPGNIEDFARISKLRQKKLEEVQELQQMSKRSKRTGDKVDYSRLISKAKQWYTIDDADYKRLEQSRHTFMQQSLQNYLLALRASDKHDISVMRFFALWLENSETTEANTIVEKYLSGVPSWKFVRLMNQLMSRLDNDKSAFQVSLQSLALRMCSDHPYHSLHHLFASSRKPATQDHAAIGRYETSMHIRKQLHNVAEKAELLRVWFAADNCYHALATTNTDPYKATKMAVKDFPAASKMVKAVSELNVPPATINLTLRADSNYGNVPIIVKFGSTIGFMGGLSRPIKLTATASDGQQYTQLYKGGNDDLRQDAIMEQVFEEVSKMLRQHKATRQRNLHVRTYKVIPLTNKSGMIEFVPNSTSLTDFLNPAHQRYHPADYKPSTAREKINAVRDHSTDVRIKEYRKVCDHMHPVLRHFFFENFNDPDEWFEKRTAYTRTSATASILGYVLGLGDRHCQNIMLDEKTGEVVHIDLGVAFEAGRVLPIPELVPFRLTRDIVDGMGITKTEGVFRRCCEFTMDALRGDKDSIMTLLNVLRYDPLYSWSISPLRAKRMQDATETARDGADGGAEGSPRNKGEAGEADRALSIVEKKLSKTLSTAATVNELIQQATDERNLATIFSGWAAYF